jgi:Na+-translocating ferredoxin:NAD+ oxidoreductase RnfG subunit
MVKKALHFALFLAIISTLAGGALAYVNSITAPIIAENAIAAEKANLVIIFPTATSFAPMTVENDESGLIKAAYTAEGVGIAYKVEVLGYAAPITFLVGFSDEGKIVGLSILDLKDTQGIGTRVNTPEFIDGVVGKSTTEGIATLSGATVSSGAVVKGIDAAKVHFNALKGIEGGTGGVVVPPLQFSTPISIFASTVGTVIEKTVDGDVTTYIASGRGYRVIEGYEGAKENIFEIKINTATNKVVSVKFVEMNDTKGIGDKIDAKEFWDQFVDLDITDQNSEIDAVSGATYTSQSAVRALRAAIDD